MKNLFLFALLISFYIKAADHKEPNFEQIGREAVRDADAAEEQQVEETDDDDDETRTLEERVKKMMAELAAESAAMRGLEDSMKDLDTVITATIFALANEVGKTEEYTKKLDNLLGKDIQEIHHERFNLLVELSKEVGIKNNEKSGEVLFKEILQIIHALKIQKIEGNQDTNGQGCIIL